MTATATIKAGPGVVPGLGLIAIYEVALDNSFLATGEPIDLTGQFSEVFSASIEGADALADHGYKFDVVLPAFGTAISDANVLVTGHWAPAQDGDAEVHLPFEHMDTDDMSGVTSLRLVVIGLAIT